MHQKNRTQKRQQKRKSSSTLVCKIYANWCGHCQDLKPVWAELKNLMSPNKNVAMIEIEESEMQEKMGKLKNICKKDINVNGFPTIVKICDKGNKHRKPIVEYYEGERSVNALRAWIMPTKGSHMPTNKKNQTRKTY
jgi:thiol-disulfide isomerase/thioredoxin